MIDERFMALGACQFKLRPDTPWRIRDLIEEHDQLVVAPVRGMLHGADRDYLYSQARYRGVLLERDWDGFGWTGAGMLWHLSDASGIGRVYTGLTPFAAPTNWSGHVAAIITDGATKMGGFTIETFNSTGGTPSGTWPADPDSSEDAPRPILQRLVWLAGVLGVEFYATATGSFYAGRIGSTLFEGQTTAAPSVIAVRGDKGRDINLVGLDAEWDGRRDWWDYAPGAYVRTDAGVSILTGAGVGNVTGTSVTRFAYEESQGDLTDGDARAAAMVRENTEKDQVRLRVHDRDVRRLIKPGDWMHLYDPTNGYFDTAEQTTYHGRHLHPARIRVMAMSWPIEPHMGVYIVPSLTSDTREPLDISDYVIPDDSPATLELGATSRPLRLN